MYNYTLSCIFLRKDLFYATFFFFAFGNLNDADFETVQAALVKESDNPAFGFFLDQVQSGDPELIALHEMSEDEALDALNQKKISGIYYEQAVPSLTLNGQGIPESILQSVLESYENNLHTIQTILKKHPSGLLSALQQMSDTKDLVREVSLGGKTIDGNSQFFYALVAMGCLYGCDRSASVSAKYPETGFSGTVRQNAARFPVRKPDWCIYGIIYRKS